MFLHLHFQGRCQLTRAVCFMNNSCRDAKPHLNQFCLYFSQPVVSESKHINAKAEILLCKLSFLRTHLIERILFSSISPETDFNSDTLYLLKNKKKQFGLILPLFYYVGFFSLKFHLGFRIELCHKMSEKLEFQFCFNFNSSKVQWT